MIAAPLSTGKLVRTLDAVRAAAIEAAAMIGRAGLFVALAVFGGIGSGWYLTTKPSSITALRSGPWVSWVAAGRPEADPYTRARFSRLGSLPLNAAVAQTFEARTDDGGQNLHSACEYAVEGSEIDAAWWSLGVYSESGQLIPNAAERHAFNSATMARSADGTFLVTLAREARPGNWLPTGGAGRLVLMLQINQAPSQLKLLDPGTGGSRLPTIRRLQCR